MSIKLEGCRWSSYLVYSHYIYINFPQRKKDWSLLKCTKLRIVIGYRIYCEIGSYFTENQACMKLRRISSLGFIIPLLSVIASVYVNVISSSKYGESLISRNLK